ncbi:MAG: hypothetical protein O3B72_08850 [Proteobacteria bacterium]|nr:hypothetical protein [Pseudomonadota bacterium]
MDEDFQYRHITKLPWLAAFAWSMLLARVIQCFPLESLLLESGRLFVFGASFVLLVGFLDDWAVRFRRRVLFSNPEVKRVYIQEKIRELNEEE